MKPYRTLLLLAAASSALWPQSFNFLPGVTYPAGNGPLAVASGDFNGDEKADLVVGNTSSGSLSIYLGNGEGSFAPASTVSLPGCVVEFVATGDFNRDGHTDVLAVCALQSTVWVVPGLGTGQFGKPISTTVPNIILGGQVEGLLSAFVVADFNHDGIPDLVLGLVGADAFNQSSFSIDLLLGNGDGTFKLSTIVPAGQSPSLPGVILAADFNRDGNIDLAVAGGPMNPGTAQLQVFLGNGLGSFQPGVSVTFPAGFSAGAGTIADVNGDGIPDVILFLASKQQEEVAVFLGAGDGTFKQLPPQPQAQPIAGMLAAHFREASAIDLLEVIVDEGSGLAVDLCAGNGDGTFQSGVPMAFPSGLQPWPLAVAAGDWNGDGLTDLAFAALPAGTLISGSTSSKTLAGVIQTLQSLPAGDLVVILNGLTPMPALAVSENQVQFAYIGGGTTPPAQSVAISNSGTGTLNWTASADSAWLKISPASGAAPANLSISISPAGLTPATYTGHVQISGAGTAGSPQIVTVTLVISAPSTAPVITGVVNGASFQPGIESGSWVTVLGSNLSNTNPGRTWTAGEIVNGNLPQALNGTSVTIDGKPAYVYYISPTQLNVQAPTDSAIGSVPVVVTNNSQTSAPFNGQLQAAAPAFFLYSGTSNAIASHYPDYALVGTSSAPAHPGDVLILWATGFGPTNPVTPAGMVVTGAPAVAAPPTFTVGGAPVSVIDAGLTPGSAGLYQIAIQLPASVPTGAVAIQASVGGTLSPPNIMIFVAAQ